MTTTLEKPIVKKTSVKTSPAMAKRNPTIKKKQELPERTNMEDIIFSRRSTRNYKKKQVPEPMIRRILEAGRFAPSAGNCQPWRFIVIQRAEMIEEMVASIKNSLLPLKIMANSEKDGVVQQLFVAATSLLSKNIGDLRPIGAAAKVLKGELKIFHDAPTVILVLKDTRGIDSPEFDTGICSQNMVLTAEAMGLGSCYIGFVTLLEKNASWLKKMNIEYPWAISAGFVVGFPKYKSQGEVARDSPQIDYYDESNRNPRILY